MPSHTHVGTVSPLRTSATFDWNLTGLDEHLAKCKDGEMVTLISPSFDNDRWRLQFHVYQADSSDPCGLFLGCLPHQSERTSATEWRRGLFTVTFEVINMHTKVTLKRLTLKKEFDNVGSSWGFRKSIERKIVEEISDRKEPVGIRVSVKLGDHEEPRAPAALPAELFDDPLYANVVFRLVDTKPETYFFAMKPFLLAHSDYFATLFESGLSEALSTVSLDASSQYGPPADWYDGDSLDFATFFPDTPITDENMVIDSAEEPAMDVAEEGDSGPSKSPRNAATFDSYLRYLHYSTIEFVPPVSQYLAETENPTIMGAQAWLAAKRADNQTSACSAHALYRLADLYLDDELRAQAKQHILGSLRVSNAAYEAFSSLSLHFSEIRDGVVAFILRNWTEILDGLVPKAG